MSDKEEIGKYISLVKDAWDKIFLARRTRDKRSRDKAIRDARIYAQNVVRPYKVRLIELCHFENLGDELFDWGHLEGDLHDVYEKLKELHNS